MSLTPLALQSAFSQIHKKKEPDARRRGRLFEAALMRLTQWWQGTFFEAEERGSGEIQSRTFDEVAALIRHRESMKVGRPTLYHYSLSYTESKHLDSDSEEEGEVIRSVKSLQKHALLRYGSRDVSAQLFTALCRALGLPARHVVSIQSVPWKANVGRTSDVQRFQTEEAEEAEYPPPFDRKGKGKAVFPGTGQTLSGEASAQTENLTVKLRKQRPKVRTLGPLRRGESPSWQCLYYQFINYCQNHQRPLEDTSQRSGPRYFLVQMGGG